MNKTTYKFKSFSRRFLTYGNRIKIDKLLLFFICLISISVFNEVVAQSGTVFRDFNGDGVKSTNEPLIPGVIVNAYNTSNMLCGTATTSGTTTPNYSLSGCGTAAVRVEFSIPTSGVCANSAIDFSSLGGTTYGSSVQFVNGNSTNVNFAIHNPNDYNQGTIDVLAFVPCYISGDPLVGDPANTWFVGYPYTNTGTSTAPTQTLSGEVIGSTWGVAYSKQANVIFTSALFKRHVGLGVMGSGGIYKLIPNATSFTATQFFDLDNNSFNTASNPITRTRADGTAPAYGLASSYSIAADDATITYLDGGAGNDPLTGKPWGLGVIGTNSDRGLSANPVTPTYDPAAFDQAGKVGLGDIEISDDGKFLFVMNVYSRKVFRLELNSATNPTSVTAVTSYDIPATTCSNGEYRPWGLKFFRGKLYVGVTCSGENGGTAADLSAFVYRLDAPTAGATFNTTPLITVPLNYDRNGQDWNPWTNSSLETDNPAPLLSTIEFTDNGDMVLSFMDRAGNQFGDDNYTFLINDTNAGSYTSEGDILIAGLDCGSSTETYTLEDNGSVVSANGATLVTVNGANAGPGGKEFFDDDSFQNDPHPETTIGSATVLKGQGSVYSTAYAMFSGNGNSGDGGMLSLSTTNGTALDAYKLYDRNTPGVLAKAAGLGDVEISSLISPIEIGNRVWADTDLDGIQDADELPIAGVIVQLLNSAGMVIATDTTDANGNYYFSSGPGTNTSSSKYNIAALQANMMYTVRIPNVTGGSKQMALGTNNLTVANSDMTTNGDLRDSDGQLVGVNADVTLTTGGVGENNHTFDFGFSQNSCVTPSVVLTPTASTCLTNGSPGNNGVIQLISQTNGTHYGVSTLNAASYNGPTTIAGATAIPGSLPTTILMNVPHTGGTYRIRIFNGDDACFVDSVVVVPSGLPCTAPCITPSAVFTPMASTCLPNGSPGNNGTIQFTSQTNVTHYGVSTANAASYDGPTTTAGATVIPTLPTNIITNVTHSGATYRIRIFNGTDGCFTDIVVVVPAGLPCTAPCVTPSAVFAPTASTCLPNGSPGNNGTIQFTSQTNVTHYGVSTAGAASYNGPTTTAGATVIPALPANIITNAPHTGATYRIRIFNGTDGCFTDIVVVVPAGLPCCVPPSAVFTPTASACLPDGSPGNNGTIQFTSQTNGTHYGLSTANAASYDGPTTTAGATAIPTLPINIISNAPHTGATYRIRIFNGTDACFTDSVVVVPAGAICPTHSIGNKLWVDANNNGVEDGGEAPISGVTVILHQVVNGVCLPVDTVLTNTNGLYLFDSLLAGNYIVEIAASNFTSTGPLASFTSSTGSGLANLLTGPSENGSILADNGVNSDDNGVFGRNAMFASSVTSDTIRLGSNEPLNEEPIAGQDNDPLTADARENLTIDFGFVPMVSLGNQVWRDDNNNGIKDPSESPIANVLVELHYFDPLTGTCILVDSVRTDASGLYLFDSLGEGKYVVVLPASNFEPGQPFNGMVSSTGGGASDTSPNPTSTYEGATPFDADSNIDGDDNGRFTPAGMFPGAIVSDTVTLTVGLEPTSENPNNDPLTPNSSSNLTIDFGLVPMMSIGNELWVDANNNGVKDAGELAVPNGVKVILHYVDPATGLCVVIDSVTTIGGLYLFDSLISGKYIVEIAASNFAPGGPLSGYLSSTGGASNTATGPYEVPGAPVDADGNINSDDNGVYTPGGMFPGSVVSDTVTLAFQTEPTVTDTIPNNDRSGASDNNSNLSIDFGFFPIHSIGNKIWTDNNNNGLEDAGESAIAGVTVILHRVVNGVCVVVGTTMTGGNGLYLFDSLLAGDYIVEVAASNFTLGGPLYYTTSSTGSGPGNLTTGGYEDGALDNVTNAGNRNDNGQLNRFPAMFPGSVVSDTIRLNNTQPLTEESGAQDNDPLTQDNRENLTIDFGFVPMVSLGNQVWRDDNNNGIKDPSESPIANVLVELHYFDPLTGTCIIVDSVRTDASGLYLFDSLGEGKYVVVLPASNFAPGQPFNGMVSSTGGGASDTSPNPTSTYEGTNPIDADNNLDSDDNGKFTPGGMFPGAIVSDTVTLTSGLEPTSENPNNDPLTPNSSSNLTIDFGLVPMMSIGNELWVDANNNGLKDAGELAVPNGVKVILHYVDPATGLCVVIDSVTTIGGLYLFDSLISGKYIVEIAASNFAPGGPLSGYASSTGSGSETATGPYEVPGAPIDADGNINSDDNGVFTPGGMFPGSVVSDTVTLAFQTEPTNDTTPNNDNSGASNNNSNLSIDFGFIELYSLGNQVWRDDNFNGLRDGSEPGMVGVTLELHRVIVGSMGQDSCELVETLITDANGRYLFDSLLPGKYIVVIPAADVNNGGVLQNYVSTTGTFNQGGIYENLSNPIDADNNTDNDDNGLLNGNPMFPGAVVSDTVTLGMRLEPTGESNNGEDVSTTDDRSNLSIDFGFAQKVMDLALVKTTMKMTGFRYGDTAMFEIKVVNQGNVPAEAIKVTDYVPLGFEFYVPQVAQLPSLQWMFNPSTMQGMVMPNKVILPRDTCKFEVDLIIRMSSVNGSFVNRGEISSFTDTTGIVRSDIDSEPDNTNGNDNGYLPFSPADNYLDGMAFDTIRNPDGSYTLTPNGGAPNDGVASSDEDDEDGELIEIIDLALRKELITVGPFKYKDTVEFKVTVFNQGSIPMREIKMVDSMGVGLDFVAGSIKIDGVTKNETISDDKVYYTISQTDMRADRPLIQGDSVIVTYKAVIRQVRQITDLTAWDNQTEIREVTDFRNLVYTGDIDGDFGDDFSSEDTQPETPDDDNITGDEINEDEDLDSKDPVRVKIYDVALRKVLKNPDTVYGSGDVVELLIKVYNQGNQSLTNIEITDYLPPTMTLVGATNNPLWINMGSRAKYLIADTLEAGDSIILALNVVFDISKGKKLEDFLNFAEVSMFEDTTGQEASGETGDIVDADSTPDDVKENDGGSQWDGPSNDAIDGDGTGTVFEEGTAEEDEDDNDVVFVIPCQQLACYNEVNVSLDGECEIEITPSVTLNAIYTGRPYYVIVKDLRGNIIPGNIVNRSHVGQRLIVEVHEPEFCGNNTCWGYINVEDKLGPKLEAPKDTCVYCVESTLPTRTGQATATDCGSIPKVEYRDVVVDFACKKDGDTIQIITRTWFATDDKGNTTTSVQKIYVKAISSDSIKAPVALVTLACTDAYTPEAIASNLGVSYGYPHYISPVTGLPVAITRGSSCHFAADYVDKPILEEVCKANCKSTQKILRTWTVLNWCTGKAEKYLQVIKLEDKIAPTIRVTSPSEIYSVNAWGCDVDITMPTATVRDACDADATVVSIQGPVGVSVVKRGNTWVALNVPSGTHTFTYYASDCCGNESTATITVKVVDRVAPVATAKEFITVSLVRSGADDILGVAKLFVDQVDNGSYDNCTKVYREIRREDDAPACLNTGGVMANGQLYNNNRTYNSTINGLDQSTSLHLQDNTLDTDKGQFVKFCCEDIGKEVKVWLRVWDDANGSGIYGDLVDGLSDNYNETWSNVKVEDKTVPRITCKPDVTIDCARDTGVVTEYNFSSTWISTVGKVPARMLPGIEGACGVYEFEFRDAGSLNTCNEGTFTRTYRVKGHTGVTCTQKIVVEDTKADPRLEWPIDLHLWNSCTLTEADVLANTVRADLEDGYERTSKNSNGENGNNCASGTNDWYCIGLTGSALSRCRANATNGFTPTSGPLGADLRDKVRFNPNYKDVGCNVYGRKITIEEYAVGEGCKKWVVRWDYINWCDNSNAGCRTTIYKFEDTTAPVITSCPGADEDIEDATCTFPIVLRPTATDAGGCDAALTWRARIYEGTNIGINPTGSILRTATGVGTNPTISFTGANALEAGTYTVRYFVTDGCGNVSECDATIGIWPKAATPYCVSLSSAVMKNGLVELWARDFDKGSFTNCKSGVMLFTFNRGGAAEHPAPAHLDRRHIFTGFGVVEAVLEGPNESTTAVKNAAWAKYNAGTAQLWLPDVTVRPRPTLPNGTAQPDERIVTGGTSGMQFGCKAGNTIGVPITVEMRVWDRRSFKEGTTQGSDFCSTRLTLIDNQGGCGANTLVTLGGTVQTESVEMMNAVDISLKAELPEYPQATKTDKDGKYTFSNLPIGVNYTIEAKKGDDYINGVNTLDLVQIQRHILGIKKLDNPYKLIAADADGDKAIRVNDIVTLRKMILGITDKIEEMPSWRFVDASDRMENGPWPFREAISHGALTETTTKNNFIGVKIGDVDGTASANAISKSTQPRSTGVRLSVEDRAVKAGEEVEISLTAEQFNEVHGMQLTLSHAGMELVSIDGRAIDLANDNVGKVSKDKTTLSWASANGTTVAQGSEVMRMRFRATKAQQLSNALQITSEVTGAEAYIGTDMERSGIVLEVRGKEGRPFAVGQNEPNPWKTSTMIRYELPAAGAVKLTVMDVTGKVIRKYDTKGVAGVNEVRMTREELNGATGILIYKVESGNHLVQKKMLVIE